MEDKALMPQISIIIPVYNSEKYLRECLDSVVGQTISDIEIICVNDGSTDGSLEILKKYAVKDERIRIIDKENEGSVSARNAGIIEARGEYVGFVDSDDWIEKDMYERMYSCIIDNKADIAAFAKYRNDDISQQKVVQYLECGIYDRNNNFQELISNLIYTKGYQQKGVSPNVYTKLFKRSLLEKYALKIDKRTKFAEDDICVYSCIINSKRVVVSNEAYYHYRLHDNSICTTADDEYFEKILLFYNQLKRIFSDSEYSCELMKQLNHYMAEFTIHGINKLFGYGDVIPYYIIPDNILQIIRNKRIVLYGAGNVGNNYRRFLEINKIADIVLWVDKNKQKNGVHNPQDIRHSSYDYILIAVQGDDLMEKIKSELLGMDVPSEAIIFGSPQSIIGTF